MDTNKIKKNKALLLALSQSIAEVVGIICYLAFVIAFLVSFGHLVYKHCFTEGFDAEDLVKKSLSSFELLFIAPIPVLVIFAFKAIMIRIYPGFFKTPEDDVTNMLKLDYAKKTFISSIIGVFAIYILSQFFEAGSLTLDYLKVALSFGFLIILIGYYYILSSHSKD